MCLHHFKQICSFCSFRCEACVGKWPTLNNLPKDPPNNKETGQMLKTAGINSRSQEEFERFNYYLRFGVLTDHEMLPKMENLLGALHKKNKRVNKLYCELQESIKNHYRALGNCLFFKDAKDVFDGVKRFSARDAIDRLPENLVTSVIRRFPDGTVRFI